MGVKGVRSHDFREGCCDKSVPARRPLTGFSAAAYPRSQVPLRTACSSPIDVGRYGLEGSVQSRNQSWGLT